MEYANQTNQKFESKNFVNREAVNTAGMQKNLPEKRFTTGAISATIWRNESLDKKGNKVDYRTVTIQKRYSGKDGIWRTSNSLRVDDLPKVALLLGKAYEFIVLKQNLYEPANFPQVVKDTSIEEEIII